MITVVIILFGPVHLNLKFTSIVASFFAVIVILFKSLDVLPDFLNKKLEWLGDRSYSIYLVHMPLVYIAKYSPVFQIGKFLPQALSLEAPGLLQHDLELGMLLFMEEIPISVF